MTLIELLVVIVILTTIVAAAIPILSPSNDDRRLRETARGVNTFFNGAQSRAIGRKRPVGVALKRLSQDTTRAADRAVCLELFYVEQPAPYTGFDANSRACVALQGTNVLIRFVTRGTIIDQMQDGLPVGWDPDLFPTGTVYPGDVIEINGTQFRLLAPSSNMGLDLDTKGSFKQTNQNRPATIVAKPVNDSGQQINPRYDGLGNEIGSVAAANPPYWTSPSPYKILRQPAPTADEPYQLPEGTAIDLRASGIGRNDYFYVPAQNDNNEGILIMFAPEGRISRVSYSQLPGNTTAFDQPVVDNVFLLVGRRDKSPPPAVGTDPTLNPADWMAAVTDDQRNRLREPVNWLSGTSRWVVIGPQSGRIATIENAAVDPKAVLSKPMFPNATPSTEEMRCAQILAAREFTREMAQLGGR
jgi:type II secretory pathway pseudopilin PulG